MSKQVTIGNKLYPVKNLATRGATVTAVTVIALAAMRKQPWYIKAGVIAAGYGASVLLSNALFAPKDKLDAMKDEQEQVQY